MKEKEKFEINGEFGGLDVEIYPDNKAFDITVHGSIWNLNQTHLSKEEMKLFVKKIKKYLK